jgi:multidrug efflux system outer membrane protein
MSGRTCHAAAIGAAVLITAVALGACALGPDYEHPDTPTPGEWREGDAAENPAWPAADWWQEFGSAELNDMMTAAQQANADLGAAIARVKQADAQARIAGAPLLPSVGANAGASKQRVLFPTTTGKPIPYGDYTAGLSASYEIDFWGKNAASLAAAQAAYHASRYDQEVIALTVVSGVATMYFQALGLQDRLQVAYDNLANAEAVLKIILNQARVGTAMELDVAQQETVVAGLRATIPPLQQQFSQSLDALAILLNRTPDNMRLAAQSLVPIAVPVVAPGLPSELLARRPDVREADIKVARAAFFPSVTLSASGGFEALGLASGLTPVSAIYSLAASLTQPIFEGGALRGQLAYSKARYEELLQNYSSAVISAFSNVEDALAATHRTTEQQESQQIAVDKARRAYQVAQLQYRAGSSDLLTVLNTQTAFFSANDLLSQVRIARMQALVSLFRALGGGWQDSGPQDEAMATTPPTANNHR